MFRNLHRNMTLFCTLITSGILVAMTVICLLLSERAMRETLHQVFLRDLNSAVFHLESQSVITRDWLMELEEGNYLVSLYDKDKPLVHNGLRENQWALCQQVRDLAMDACQLDVMAPPETLRSAVWHDFTMRGRDGHTYFAAAVLLPRKSGGLGAVFLMPLLEQDKRFAAQWLLFAGIDLAGVGALLLFGWFFTGKMLHPLRETREKQVQFVAAASHELRSPLAVMLSELSALERAEPEQRTHFQESIRAEGMRMSRLIDDLLTLSSAESARSWAMLTKPASLDTMTLNLYEKYLSPAREKGLRLTVSLPEEGIAPVCCDGERVEQAVRTLLSNALSYTPSGGQVELILEKLSGGRVRFTVRDNGPGIPDSEKHKIFQRFYRIDSSRQDREHFGLGLSVAREIARIHRGRLWVEDTPGGGACFRLII